MKKTKNNHAVMQDLHSLVNMAVTLKAHSVAPEAITELEKLIVTTLAKVQ